VQILKDLLTGMFPTGVVLGLLYFFRERIAEAFSKYTTFRFDQKLEQLKASLQNDNARLTALLQQNNTEIDVLRTNMLSELGEKRKILDVKRLESSEELYFLVNEFMKKKFWVMIVGMMKVEKFETMSDSERIKLSEVAKLITGQFDIEKWTADVNKFETKAQRLYVPSEVWGLASAIKAITSTAIATLKTLEIDPKFATIPDQYSLQKMVVETIPDSKSGFDQFGPAFAYRQIDVIHERFIGELKKMIDGTDFDEAAFQRASKISTMSRFVNSEAPDLPKEFLNSGLSS
jgi:hypothetical protein